MAASVSCWRFWRERGESETAFCNALLRNELKRLGRGQREIEQKLTKETKGAEWGLDLDFGENAERMGRGSATRGFGTGYKAMPKRLNHRERREHRDGKCGLGHGWAGIARKTR
jgi:hypothetical protein